MFNFHTFPPLSLYIHIPWCIRKCPYCDFNSYKLQGKLPENDYITALLADLAQDLPNEKRPIRSIFIGGGTPSLLSPEAINNLLSGIVRLSDAEITLEANPGTVTRFQEFREAGINRLSLGIQSFNENALKKIERIHGRREAISAIHAAQEAGFTNLNLDLMFGLPGQTVVAALDDLQTAVSFQPNHLSWYQLTIEANSSFYHLLPNDDLLWEIQVAGQQYLKEQGYFQYEISAYAKLGGQCQHNLNYWKFGDYLGIGAGAHGKISSLDSITRFSKSRDPQTYLNALVTEHERLTVDEVVLEFMINALRLVEGFTFQEFLDNTGLNLTSIEKTVQHAQARGWLECDTQGIHATETGMRFLNDVLALFVH